MKKKILVVAPALSASGYGEMARFALKALKQNEDKFDIYLNIITWGNTGFLFERNEEYEWLNSLRTKTQEYASASGKYDLSLQITIPNEWKQYAPINIGYTAGIETTTISPAWLEPSNMMDRIIVISEHAKKVYQSTIFSNNEGKQFKVTTPIDVVHFPFNTNTGDGANIDFNLKNDFNFLSVNQWGPRKNIEQLISCFVDEFLTEEVGLVIKTNNSNDSIIDRNICEKRIEQILESKSSKRKCSIKLIHGRLSEKEMRSLYMNEKIKAFATSTHGEGFGFPIFEAASAGLPIVATDWSGHLDFLTIPDETGVEKKVFGRVEYDLKQINPAIVWQGVMEKETGWAYPKESSLKVKLREVYRDYSRYKSFAKKLSEHNKEKFNEQKVNSLFVNSLMV